MTGNIEEFENSGVRKVLSKQNELDKYYKLFAPKDSIRKKILNYQSSNMLPETDKVIEIMCRYNTKVSTKERRKFPPEMSGVKQ